VYYTIARELAPVSVGIFRTVIKNRDNDRPQQFYEFGAFLAVNATIDIWATNALLSLRPVKLALTCFDLLSEWTHSETSDVVLQPNQSTELLSMPCPCPPAKDSTGPLVTPSYSVIVGVQLLDPASGVVIARYADWPQPYRHTDYPDPGLNVEVRGEEVEVSVKRPVKGLVLSVEDDGAGEEVKWSDNALDVLPGWSQTVRAIGLRDRGVRVAYMGRERATRV